MYTGTSCFPQASTTRAIFSSVMPVVPPTSMASVPVAATSSNVSPSTSVLSGSIFTMWSQSAQSLMLMCDCRRTVKPLRMFGDGESVRAVGV